MFANFSLFASSNLSPLLNSGADVMCSSIIVFVSYNSFESFSHQRYLMVFHWSVSGSKSPQIYKTLRSILADLNAVVWMVYSCPLISKSSNLGINPLLTVLNTPIKLESPSLSCSIVFSVR